MLKRTLLIAAITAMLLSGAAVRADAAPAPWPGVKLLTTEDFVEVVRWPDEPFIGDLGIVVAAGNRPFELHLSKSNYRAPIRVTQHDRTGRRSRFLAEATKASFAEGLKDFFIVTVTRPDGTRVLRRDAGFCTDAWDRMRLTISAPETSRYPNGCSDIPYAKGTVLGIEAGWGMPLRTMPALNVPDGEYTVTISVRYGYRRLFSISEQDAVASVDVSLVTVDECCVEPPPEMRARRRAAAAAPLRPVRPSGAPAAAPATDTRPDLVAIPAWNIRIGNPDGHVDEPQPEPEGRDILRFSSTVWNAGPAPLVVDGFRNKGEPEMTGYQSFYKNGKRVGWKQIGAFEFDDRDGHQHWHFKDFAQYRLLDAGKMDVLPAGKEAFCLAPTNAIDMTVPGADWSVHRVEFPGSMCGQRSSLAIREVLQAGWADTYGTGTPGQEFDVTDLPNGTYFIEVAANPLGRLIERVTSNNVALREIVLGGTPGNRTVVVRPYQGIAA